MAYVADGGGGGVRPRDGLVGGGGGYGRDGGTRMGARGVTKGAAGGEVVLVLCVVVG